jgi:hypothetical protein
MQAFNIAITAITLILVGYIFGDFILGLFDLWDASNPRLRVNVIAPNALPDSPISVSKPQVEQIPDPWLLPTEITASDEQPVVKVIAPTPLLLLPPAKEIVVTTAKTRKPQKKSENLHQLNITELKKRASQVKIKGYSRMSKSQLLAALA